MVVAPRRQPVELVGPVGHLVDQAEPMCSVCVFVCLRCLKTQGNV